MLILLLVLILLVLLFGASAVFGFLGSVGKVIVVVVIGFLGVYLYQVYPQIILIIAGIFALMLIGAIVYEKVTPAEERQRRQEEALAQRLGVEKGPDGEYRVKQP